jgi:hypothetical protein
MSVSHVDNDTPKATADDVKTTYKDTPAGGRDAAKQGVGVSPLPIDSQDADDPKEAGTPVHRRPSEEHAHS